MLTLSFHLERGECLEIGPVGGMSLARGIHDTFVPGEMPAFHAKLRKPLFENCHKAFHRCRIERPPGTDACHRLTSES